MSATLQHPISLGGAPSAGTARLTHPRIVAGAVTIAVAANLAIWGVGSLAGGSFEFVNGTTTETVGPGAVALLSAVPLAVGLTVMALVAGRAPRLVGPAKVLGSILAVGTIAVTLDAGFDGASTVALSLTHLTLVPVLVVGLELVRRRAAVRADGR